MSILAVVMIAFVLGLILPKAITVAAESSAPTGVRTSPATITDSSAWVVWSKPDFVPEGKSVVDYEVFVGGASVGLSSANFESNNMYLDTWLDNFYAKTPALTGSAGQHEEMLHQSFNVTGLNASTKYTVSVKAVYDDASVGADAGAVTFSTQITAVVLNAANFGATYVIKPGVAPSPSTPEYEAQVAKWQGVKTKGASNDAALIAEIAANTEAIQAAIDATPKYGKVVLPGSGDNTNPYYYVSGSLFLKSNMTFEIEEGATLLGSPVFDHYPRSLLVYPYSQDIRTYGLVNGVSWDEGSLENIRLVGDGTIDGNGWKASGATLATGGWVEVWQNPMLTGQGVDVNPAEMATAGIVDPTGNAWRLPNYYGGSNSNVKNTGVLAGDAHEKSEADRTPNSAIAQWYNTRPNLTVVRGVVGISYEGLTFKNCAFHGIVNYGSHGITQVGTKVMTYNNNNGDGIEFGDSLDMIIFNNFFDTGDDAINFAAGQGAVVRNRSERVASGEGHIFNNMVRMSHGGLLAMGSHIGGWIGDIVAEQNVYLGSEGGNGAIRIKAGVTTGGGVRNIIVRNNTLHGQATSSFVAFDCAYSDGNASTAFAPESDFPTTYKNFLIEDNTVSGSINTIFSINAVNTANVSHLFDVRDIVFQNIKCYGSSTGSISINASSVMHNVLFKNVSKYNVSGTAVNVTVSSIPAACKNVTVSNVGTATTADRTILDHEWANSDELAATIVDNKIDLSWPELATLAGVQYSVMIKDNTSRSYMFCDQDLPAAEVIKQAGNTLTTYVPESGSYTYTVYAETTTGRSQIGLSKTVDVEPFVVTLDPTAITIPATISFTPATSGAGQAWLQMTWRKATSSKAPIYFYELVCEATDGTILTYRDYNNFNATTAGYTLSDLMGGTGYTVKIFAVDFFGNKADYGINHSFNTPLQVQMELPVWATGAVISSSKGANAPQGSVVNLSWTAADISNMMSDEATAFAGYRILVNGVALQPSAAVLTALETAGNPYQEKLTQPNATPTTLAETFALDIAGWAVGTYEISVQAGYQILKYQSGFELSSGGASTGFTGVNNTDLERNKVTFGKWSQGPSMILTVYPVVTDFDYDVYVPDFDVHTSVSNEFLKSLVTVTDVVWSDGVARTPEIAVTKNISSNTITIKVDEKSVTVPFKFTGVYIARIQAEINDYSVPIYASATEEELRSLIDITSIVNNDGSIPPIVGDYDLIVDVPNNLVTVKYRGVYSYVTVNFIPVELVSIQANLAIGATFTTDDTLEDVLNKLTVTGVNNDGTTVAIQKADVELIGAMVEGSRDIRVTAKGHNAIVSVTVAAGVGTGSGGGAQGGLPLGGTVAIVVGSIIIIAAVGCLVWWLLFKKKAK